MSHGGHRAPRANSLRSLWLCYLSVFHTESQERTCSLVADDDAGRTSLQTTCDQAFSIGNQRQKGTGHAVTRDGKVSQSRNSKKLEGGETTGMLGRIELASRVP